MIGFCYLKLSINETIHRRNLENQTIFPGYPDKSAVFRWANLEKFSDDKILIEFGLCKILNINNLSINNLTLGEMWDLFISIFLSYFVNPAN